MKRFCAGVLSVMMIIMFGAGMVACKNKKEAEIDLPQQITLTEESNEPELKVYDTKTESIITLGLEEYVKGVLAGEMINSWNIEALKAQAILARTYTLWFLKNKTSKYPGADISTDITEAQAYNAELINDNIEHAVNETQGKIIVQDGEPIQAWFHSNSGGKTTRAATGLSFLDDENFTKMADSPETDINSKNYSWAVTISKSEVLQALRKMGVGVSTISSFEVADTDESGRAINFRVGDTEFSATTFRINVGSTKLKSTLITDIVVSASSIAFSGRGYGHGVGLSQWGAKVMADSGKTAEEIISHYFDNIEIVDAKFGSTDN